MTRRRGEFRQGLHEASGVASSQVSTGHPARARNERSQLAIRVRRMRQQHQFVCGVKVQSGGKELTVFYCEVDGCYNVNGERQFFQSEKARDAHQRTHKKDNDA